VTRFVGPILVGVLLLASCGTTRFPRDAVAELRSAAARSSSGEGAVLGGTMDDDTGPVVVLKGSADFQHRTVTLTTSSDFHPARYPPFDARYVDGWTYVQIDSAVSRPPTIRRNVNWIAFQSRTGGLLPIPDRTMRTSFPFQFLDELRAGPITNAHFVGSPTNRPTRIQLQLPRLDTSTTTVYTVTFDSNGRIDDISSTVRFQQDGATHNQGSDLTLAWTSSVPAVEAPPADQVQRVLPGENLYAGSAPTG